MADFDKALKVVLQHEGGFTNDPLDHGHATNWGITQHDLSVFLKHPATVEDVKHMTVQTAAAIYRQDYWNIMKLDQVNSQRLATILFDQGVLSGTATAAARMQRCLGVDADGQIGPITLAALNSCDVQEVGRKFLSMLQARYHAIVENEPSQRRFLSGWLNRVQDLVDILERPDASVA